MAGFCTAFGIIFGVLHMYRAMAALKQFFGRISRTT